MKNPGKVAGVLFLGVCVLGVANIAVAAPLPTEGSPVRALSEEKEKKTDEREDIAVDKLPKAVVDGVKKAMPGARITKAAKVIAEGKTTYYLDDVKVGKKGWDVTVGEDGKILSKVECHDED